MDPGIPGLPCTVCMSHFNNFTDVTLADEDTNSIPTDEENRAILNKMCWPTSSAVMYNSFWVCFDLSNLTANSYQVMKTMGQI